MLSQVPTPDRRPTVQVNIKNLIDEVQCSQTVRESLNLSLRHEVARLIVWQVIQTQRFPVAS